MARSARFPGEPDEAAIREQFVAAARRAGELGVDVLELDMAHGYLLGSYLSPLVNREDDRLRFPLSVLHAVREVWPGVLAVRLSVTDWHPRGNSVGDGVAIARAMAEGGADLIHVEAGQTVHDDRPEYRRGFLTALSDRVRNEARVPTLVGGHLTTDRRRQHGGRRRASRPRPPRPARGRHRAPPGGK